MWCHLCKLNFMDTEIFKCHIMEKHRPESGFYKDSDCEDSEQENVDLSENFDSDIEIYNKEEDHTISSEDAVQLSSDGSLYEPSSTPESKFGLRRSNRTKKPTSKLKALNSRKNSDTQNEDQNTKNIQHAANNQLYVISPVGGQAVGQQPMFVINPLCSNMSQLNASDAFALNSKNIVNWLDKHKKLCKDLKYPLPPQLYKKVKMIHKELINHYCMASPSEENSAIFKVFEDLNDMILKHIACINAEL